MFEPVMMISLTRFSSSPRKACSLKAIPILRQSSCTTARVTPGRMKCPSGCVARWPLKTAITLVCVPSVTTPSRTKMASSAPFSLACWTAKTLPIRPMALMSQRDQRNSGTRTAPTPFSRISADDGAWETRIILVAGTGGSGKVCFRGATPRVTWK